MYRLGSALIIITLVLGELQHSAVTGYKWITLNSGDPIPNGAITISTRTQAYVGRARHYDELLPAEVYNSSYALIVSCSKEIIKRKFEILVATENCEWKQFYSIQDVPENIVLAGNAWNGEPIYVAKAGDNQYNFRLASVFLTTNKIIRWINSNSDPHALICNDSDNWVDTSSGKLPNNTVSGGQSEDEYDIFVARLKRDCHIIPGQVIPELGIATALYNGDYIESFYCQVLLGDTNKYTWVAASNGEIPDYAISAGRKNLELMYVARMNKTVGYIVHQEALYKSMVYEILTKNVE